MILLYTYIIILYSAITRTSDRFNVDLHSLRICAHKYPSASYHVVVNTNIVEAVEQDINVFRPDYTA